MLLTQIWQAMKAGEELENSASWKNKQATSSSIVAVIGLGITVLGYTGHKIEASNEDLMAIAGGIAVILGLCNSVATIATSKKVGLPSRAISDPNGPKFTTSG